MKLCRFQPGNSGKSAETETLAGVVDGGSVYEVQGLLPGARERTGRKWPESGVRFLTPSLPSKIVCVGKNYLDHAAEFGSAPPPEPLIFLKPPSAVLEPDGTVILPPISRRVDYEGELGVVIGKRCAQLGPAEDVRPYILGYTCVNDVTARDLQMRDGQWTRGKGFDTFCPFGPVIETELDPRGSRLETRVNGAQKQSAPFTEMIFPVDVIIRFVAQVMTLLPGDLICTGTPAGVGPLAAGDAVEVTISGLGTLRNAVAAQEQGGAARCG